MKRLSKILLLISFGLFLFSCSKKEEQKKDIDISVDTAVIKTDTIISSSSSKLTSSDVRKKFSEVKKKYENELDEIGKTDVKFVDLLNNGTEFAVLYYNLVAKGGNVITGSGLLIYKIDNNKLEYLQDYNLDGAVIKSIKDGTIFCMKYDYAPGDPSCCPSKKKPFKLKYENNKLNFIP
jgi:hypothetical protein